MADNIYQQQTLTNPIVQPGVDNRWMFYDFLHYIPIEDKNKYWAAQCLLFNKLNSVPLTAHVTDKIARYRDLERGEIDAQELKNIIDPKQDDGSGGEAKFFASSWKSNLINTHLRNILDARLDQMPVSLECKAVDEYFQLELQRINAQMIGRRQFLSFINEMNGKLGLPPLRDDDDPFKYVNELGKEKKPGVMGKPSDMRGGGASAKADSIMTMMDTIRNAADDNEDIALYNEYIHKDGVEVAMELGMEHYLEVNKFSDIRQSCFTNLRNFNTAAMRVYTSATNGQPVIEDKDPATIQTSMFKKMDGADMIFWWQESDITFADFMREFGADMNQDELKWIFERNRTNTGGWFGHNLYWDRCSLWERDNARIRIGYMEWLSQDMQVYSYNDNVRGNMRTSKQPTSWEPAKKSNFKKQKRYYNTWYKCYYIPAFTGTMPPTLATTDFAFQASLIFKFGPLQDQLREGDDNRYSRPSLIVRRRDIPSFVDIEQRYMSKINLLWAQMENDLANAMPSGQFFSEEAFTDLMGLVDEAQASGKDNNYEAMRKLKQTGYGVGRLFDEQGKRIPPFTEIRSGHLGSAREKLVMIMDLYAMMTRSLGINEIAEGMAPQPRQSLGGIELANQASVKATFFIESAYIDMFREVGYRLMYYFDYIVNENNSVRLKEFGDIVGRASAWAMEAIKNIPLRRIALRVDVLNNNAQAIMLNNLALQMAGGSNPLLTPDEAIQLTFIGNVKYKFALMRMKIKKRRKENMEQQAQIQQMQQQNMNMAQQLKMQEIAAKFQGQAEVVNITKQWDERLLQIEAQLKLMSQQQIKEQIKQNRIEQDQHAAQLQQQMEAQKPLT